MIRLSILALVVAACRDPRPVSAPPRPPSLEVAYERLLPNSDRDHRPLFGPDGSITVGSTRWRRDGTRLPRNHWAEDGQLLPVAVVGTADHPDVVAVAWGGLRDLPDHPDHPARDDDQSWLVAGEPGAVTPHAATATGIEFSNEGQRERGPELALSPDHTAIVGLEHDAMVVRSVPAGRELARFATDSHACWIDSTHIAWRTNASFATLDIARGTVAHVAAPPGTLVACDPGGGSAALATSEGISIVDLGTGATIGKLAIRATDQIALGNHGCELAIVEARTISIYRCQPELGALAWYQPTFVRTIRADARPPDHLAFSPDGTRLALVGTSLLVLEAGVERAAARALPALAELPESFTNVTALSPVNEEDDWQYAQLAPPTGLAALPGWIVHARLPDGEADVVSVAIDRASVSAPPPAPDATDATITTYALHVLPELFDQWRDAHVETGPGAEFTLRVGRRDGKPWFEAREFWRDGCFWYDGYTEVVIDRDLLFVTRALVAPTASTNPWLQTFFDLPFKQRMQIAREAGPDDGPC